MKRAKLMISFGILTTLLVVSFGLNFFQYGKIKKINFEKSFLISKKDEELKNLEKAIPVWEEKIEALKEKLREQEEAELKKMAEPIIQKDTLKNVMAYEKVKTVKLSSENKAAEKIFFKHLASSFNSTVEEFQELCKEFPCRIYTAEVDLNDDGVNEIIGSTNLDCEFRFCHAIVLVNKNKKWIEISDFPYVDGRFDILKEKNLGYHSIRPCTERNQADENKFAIYVIKYTKKGYNLRVYPG